jgi:hypothetical protein
MIPGSGNHYMPMHSNRVFLCLQIAIQRRFVGWRGLSDAWTVSGALHCQVPLITNNRAGYSAVDGLVLLSA